MSTKSKTAMETMEGEKNVRARPTRNNVKPVSYNENTITKRGAVTGKESSSEPKDKKKKKANGTSNGDAPTKKSGKKKADSPDEDTNDQDVEDELMPESRKQTEESKPVAGKTNSRKKKVEASAVTEDAEAAQSNDEDISEPEAQKPSKTTAQKKAKGAVEATNGKGSKPAAKGKKAEETSNGQTAAKPSKGKGKAAKESNDTEAKSDEAPAKPIAVVAPKQIPSKTTAKGKDDAEAESDSEDSQKEVTSAKPTASKKVTSKTTKGKKTAKESNDPDAESDGQDSHKEVPPSKPVAAPKAVTSKSTKGKKSPKESNVAEAESDGQNSLDEVPVKATASKPAAAKSTKGKKAAKESNDVVDDTDDASAKATKGRGKKATAKDQPRKRKAAEPLPTVIKPKVSRKVTTTTNIPAEEVSDVLDLPDGEWSMKISSWNVAGFRAMVKKDGMGYIRNENPDIICLQETKCLEDEVPDEANIEGYHKYWLGFKGGKAGVAIFTKIMPYDVSYGINDPEMDKEARLITAEYTKFYLLCVYVPNSGRKLVNLDKRMQWDEKFQEYVTRLNKKKPVIICGDMNVAHLEIDLANPKTNKRNAGFTDEERSGMSKMLAMGFVDTFRELYPNKTQQYTFWTYMANARAKNVGWRLDYFIVSERLMGLVVDTIIRSNVMGSDHCPITMFLKF